MRDPLCFQVLLLTRLAEALSSPATGVVDLMSVCLSLPSGVGLCESDSSAEYVGPVHGERQCGIGAVPESSPPYQRPALL